MKFDWDPKKAASNEKKHGISFEQAIKTFDDPDALFIDDIAHSEEESREIVIGIADESGVVFVVFTERGNDLTRIISARKATEKEKRIYAKNETAN